MVFNMPKVCLKKKKFNQMGVTKCFKIINIQKLSVLNGPEHLHLPCCAAVCAGSLSSLQGVTVRSTTAGLATGVAVVTGLVLLWHTH